VGCCEHAVADAAMSASAVREIVLRISVSLRLSEWAVLLSSST